MVVVNFLRYSFIKNNFFLACNYGD